MTGLVRKAAALAACGVLFGAAVAFAGVPDPINSTVPSRINLVGVNSGTLAIDQASLGALVSVTVRDLAANPIPNSSVVLDFTNALSDTRIGDTQPYASLATNCSTHGISAIADGSGVATFAVQGGGYAVAGAAHGAGACRVYADGVLIGTINVGTYDMNGSNGVDALDLSRLGNDVLGGTNPDRGDFDNSGATDGLDISIWAAVFFSGRSDQSAATYCP
jgi:hypothetical protein